MSSKDTQNSALNFDDQTPLFQWTSFPFMDTPYKSVMLCAIIALIAYILWQLTIVKWEQPLYYVLGILMLMIGIIPYFIPTSYFFYEEGFLVQYPLVKVQKKYTDFGCFYADKLGIMLSTYKMPRRMDTFRGQSIRFSKTASERTEILEFLRGKIGVRS